MLKVGRVNFSFSAAHHLPKHDGLCKNLHGHNYRLEVELCGQVNLETGMLIDFKKIKDLVNENVIRLLDHKNLNEVNVASFPYENPTAELMITWMADIIEYHLLGETKGHIKLHKLRLWETDNCYVEWEKD